MARHSQGYIIAFIEFMAFVSCLSSTILLLEVLGDFSWLEDKFIRTEMGDISGYQMFYWMVTTVSTVGYGDFSPTTVLSRGCIIFFIPLGVVVFTVITSQVTDLHATAASGRGRLSLNGSATPHAIVTGGAVTSASCVTMRSFLEEILHKDRHPLQPHVLLLSSDPIGEEMQHLLKERWLKGKVTWLRGHPVHSNDLKRSKFAQAGMVLVLADLFSQNPESEDETNVMLASVLLTHNPNLKMRVMLLRPASRELAVSLGVGSNRCFAINELKASIIARSCVCPGFSTLLTNLFRLEPEGAAEDGREWLKHPKFEADWMDEFIYGSTYDLYGLLLDTRFHGQTFSEVALSAYQDHAIYLLALQVDGAILMNPYSSVVTKDTVVFAAAVDLSNLLHISLGDPESGEWRKTFNTQRDMREKMLQSHGGGMHDLFGNQKSMAEDKDELSDGATIARSPTMSRMPWMPWVPVHKTKKPRSKSALENPDAKPGTNSELNLPSTLHDSTTSSSSMVKEAIGLRGHFVLVAQDHTLWQQVSTICASLLEDSSTADAPIVVICTKKCDKGLEERFPSVLFMTGNPHSIRFLQQCRISTARMVIVLSAQPNTLSDVDLDRKNLITVSLIEKCFEKLPASKAPFLLFDIHNLGNLYQLRHACPKSVSASDTKEDSSTSRKPKVAKIHPRYSGGRIVSRSGLVKFFATAFYTPGCLEIADAIATPENSGQSCKAVLLENLHCNWGKRFIEIFKFFMDHYGILVMGLSRMPTSDPSNTIDYVYSFPMADVIIYPKDK
eukprot:gene7627-9082_t